MQFERSKNLHYKEVLNTQGEYQFWKRAYFLQLETEKKRPSNRQKTNPQQAGKQQQQQNNSIGI